MNYVTQAHNQYVQKALQSSQLLPNPYSAIPTLIFMISSFIFLYQYFHRTTSMYTRWNIRLKRDFKFHWIFFNMTRLWFIFLSCMRKLIIAAENIINTNIVENQRDFNKQMTYALFTTITTSLAFIPAFLIYVNYVSRNDIPNFLMWVMDDPYMRHEIGISGHCLERPLRILNKSHKFKNYPYRSRRSTSFDDNPWLADQKPELVCRNCKSLVEQNVVKSVDNMLD